MSEIIVINPTKTSYAEQKLLRVAAYIRVSTDSEDQENSFLTQFDYYNNLIKGNPDWIFVDVYADEGITGTEMKHRDDFNRLITDCKLGKIDCIIIKSISRFARNIYDCIEITRQLKVMGINVIFEKEGINTQYMGNEIELASLSAMAQEESISLSKNLKMGIRHKMANGTFKQGNMPYGFKKENGMFVINEEQAKVVRVIFQAYMNGKGLAKIANELKLAEIKKNDGNTNWTAKTVQYILTNVRYKGDALLQKTFTDEFPFKTIRNHGECDMFYVKNANVPIVTKEVFDKTNQLLESKRKRFNSNPQMCECVLTKKVFCSHCKKPFRRKAGEVNVFWMCRERDAGADRCSVPQIAEKTILDGYVVIHNRLIKNIEYTLAPMLDQLRGFRELTLKSKGELNYINNEMAKTTEQILVLNKLKADGYIESAIFIERTNELNAKVKKLRKDKKLLLGNDEAMKVIKTTERLIAILEKSGPIARFNEQLFERIVEKVWIDSDRNITYELLNGLKLTIEYSEVN